MLMLCRCEHRSRNNRAHLILRNLQEFDLGYLKALFSTDAAMIAVHEGQAEMRGYGPLMPCTFTASPSEHKQSCRKYMLCFLCLPALIIAAHWHRFPDGTLARGKLLRWEHTCPSTFDVYVPQDLAACPKIVVICRSPHQHPPPAPIKTPKPLLEVFNALLGDLQWRLADATPRRIVLDSGFMHGLQKVLGWSLERTPTLSDLHPSLANLDHVRRKINELREKKYPCGTGFDGKIP